MSIKIPFFRNPPKHTNLDKLTDEERRLAKLEPLHYRLNPCDWSAFEGLKKLRLIIYIAAIGTYCPCCIKTRIWLALFIGNIIGVVFGVHSTIILWGVVIAAAVIVLCMPMQERAIRWLADIDSDEKSAMGVPPQPVPAMATPLQPVVTPIPKKSKPKTKTKAKKHNTSKAGA